MEEESLGPANPETTNLQESLWYHKQNKQDNGRVVVDVAKVSSETAWLLLSSAVLPDEIVVTIK